MKVKKFRLRPRLPSVGKNLKAIMGIKQLPIELEQSLIQECEPFLSHVLPTAFYQTWSQDEIPVTFRPILDAAGLGKAIAVSAAVATIGSDIEDVISQRLMNGETQRSQVLTAFSEEAAELSLQFLLRLLADDAKSDDCDLAETLPITDPAIMSETLALLEAHQEGVVLDNAQHLTPRFTRIALIAWWPISKKKRSTPAAKKKIA